MFYSFIIQIRSVWLSYGNMSLPLSNHVSSFLTFVFTTSPSTFYDSSNCEGVVPVFHAALFCAVC